MANQVRTTERRRQTRYPKTGKLRVLGEDVDGQSRMFLAELVEISLKGMKILVDAPMGARSYVSVNDREIGVMGRGCVRYCRFEKGKYAVGLEFSNGTGWKPPANLFTSL